jgi:hypothetical protein
MTKKCAASGEPPGAGGGIGTKPVAKSLGDGDKLLMGAVSTHAIDPSLYAKIGYDPQKDFVTVALVAQVPDILVVHPSLPVQAVRRRCTTSWPGRRSQLAGAVRRVRPRRGREARAGNDGAGERGWIRFRRT